MLQYEERTTANLPSACVIWLHGLGADGYDFVPLASELINCAALPIRYMFPHASVRPVTINGYIPTRAWYDVYSLSDLDHEDEQGIRDTQQELMQLINEQISRGIPPSRIILGGFSQGGAAALFTGLRAPVRLGGIIGLSTYLPLSSTLVQEANPENRGIPVFMGHGEKDPVIPCLLGQMTVEHLSERAYQTTWKTYTMEHEVSQQEIKDIDSWLLKRLDSA